MRSVRYSPLALYGWGLLLAAGGCHDPRFIKQSDMRKSRIENHLIDYRQYDAGGPQRMKQTADIHRKMQKLQKESLVKTTALAKRMHQRDVDRWRSQSDLRRERTRTYLRGKPEQINDAWGKMVY